MRLFNTRCIAAAAFGLLVAVSSIPAAQAVEPDRGEAVVLSIASAEPAPVIEAAIYRAAIPADVASDDDAATYARMPAAVGKIGPEDPDEDGDDEVRLASLHSPKLLPDTDVGWRVIA